MFLLFCNLTKKSAVCGIANEDHLGRLNTFVRIIFIANNDVHIKCNIDGEDYMSSVMTIKSTQDNGT